MNRKFIFHKISICLLALTMVFSMMLGNLNIVKANEQSQVIASWDIKANPETTPDSAVIAADIGAGFNLTTNATGSWGTSPTYFLAVSGFDGQVGSKFWQISMPESNYEDLQLSFKMRRSKTMNEKWQVLYSPDGVEYKKVSGSDYSITNTSGALKAIIWDGSETLSIPSEAKFIRIMPLEDISATGGTCYLNNIVLTAKAGNKVANVIADPDAGEVPVGTTLTLSCATVDATIHYQIGNGEELVYNKTKQPVLNTLPATVKVWASKDGLEDSDKLVLQYTEKLATIGEARKNQDAEYTLKGIATTNYDNASLGVYIQDATGGIMLYGDSILKNKGIEPGDLVLATGTTKLFSGKYELVVTDVEVTKGTDKATAQTITLDQISETYGGKYVEFNEVIVNSMTSDNYDNANLTLFKDGHSLKAKLDSRRGDGFEALAKIISENDNAKIKGILEGYDGNYTLQILGANDVEKLANVIKVDPVIASVPSGELELNSKIELTCASENAKIMYKLNAGDFVEYTQPITITSLPAALTTYATIGDERSEEITYNYREVFDGTYNIYFGQLHSHTNLSDGAGSVESAFDHASKAKNLDFLAVTDHSNSFETDNYDATINDSKDNVRFATGRAAAKAITAQKVPNTDSTSANSNFLGVYGYEMTWSDGCGHMNTFNTQGFENRNNPDFQNKKQSFSNPSGLKAYYEKLAIADGSISQFNHPGTTFGDFYDFANYSAINDARINLLEVGNGEGAIRSGGYFPSYEYYTRALDKGWHVAPTNNQDNHKGAWGDANTARSVILSEALDETSLYDALSARRVYATEDNDLSIYYTLNNQIMGSEVPNAGDKVHLEAKLSDPSDDKIGKVEVIVNGGLVAASKNVNSNNETVSFDLPNNYSYYYLRITQSDKDIAVTAPVWTGDVEKAGIANVTCDTELPIRNESVNITTNLYNNEDKAMTINTIEYSINGRVIRSIKGDELVSGEILDSLKTTTDEFRYTPSSNGEIIINVVLNATINGVEKTYNGLVKLDIADPNTVTKVVIDGSHFNDYVNGYYNGNMDNFIKLCASLGIQAKIVTDKIDSNLLKNIDLLVVTAPMKKTSSSTPEGMQPCVFEEQFINDVTNYVNAGGTVITCALADYQDSNSDPYTSSKQINDLLKAMGSSMSINSDEVVDQENNDGSSYRLKLKGTYNPTSKWLAGVVSEQEYSVYSGCSVNPGNGEALVNGYATTYSINSRKSSGEYENDKPVLNATAPYDETTAVVKKGDVTMLAAEKVGQGQVFTAGTVFLSNFEVKAEMDNIYDLQYINYNVIYNILNNVKVTLPTTKISDVRANGQAGDVFAVEGIVTVGSEAPNAFFDTIYVQDETGGINIFPIANGSGIKVGNKVRVIGFVDEYQGDKELKIGNTGIYGIEILDDAVNPLESTELTLKQANDYVNFGGLLAKVKGTVTKVKVINGILDSYWIKDEIGDEFRVFVDGYINPEVDTSKIVQVGNYVSAIGVIYNNPDGTCLRVRDRNEIILESVSAVDKSQLKDLINQILPEKDYTKDSYAKYLAAINRGKNVLANLDATQVEVNQAVANIKAAINDLEKVTNKPEEKPIDNGNASVETGDDITYGAFVMLLAVSMLAGYSLKEKNFR